MPQATISPEADEVTLVGVSYSYGEGKEVISDANLHVRPGEKVGVLSPSGTGKSTLLMLMAGLLCPHDGKIAAPAREVVYLSSNPHLFNVSLRENILLGREVSPERFQEACRLSCVDEFVHTLPQGYDTVIGEQGMALSLGQSQRVALARAILGSPKVLILDEALSGLDDKLSTAALDNLRDRNSGCSLVLATHRERTLEGFDRIFTLEDGVVREIKHAMKQID